MNQNGLTDEETTEAIRIMREDKARYLAKLESDPPVMVADEEIRQAIAYAYYTMTETVSGQDMASHKMPENESRMFAHMLDAHLYDVMERLYAYLTRKEMERREPTHLTVNAKGGTA